MKRLTALDLRKKLGSVLDEVHDRKERFLVSRANKPLAVILSIDEYEERILKKERGRKLRAICAEMEKWREQHGNATRRTDVTGAIREMRERG